MSIAALIAKFALRLAKKLPSCVSLIACAIAWDLAQPRMSLHTAQAVDGALRYAHNLLSACIHLQARHLAGLPFRVVDVPSFFRVARTSHRHVLMLRLDELLRRLERWQELAQRLAEKLRAARCGVAEPAPPPESSATRPVAPPAPVHRIPLTANAPRDGPVLPHN